MARKKMGGWNGETHSRRAAFRIRLPGNPTGLSAAEREPTIYTVSVRYSRALRQWKKVSHALRGAALLYPAPQLAR